MSKSMLTSAAFAGALLVSAAAMAQGHPPPNGSYRESCRNAHIYGDVATNAGTATTNGWFYDATTGEIHGANALGATSEDGN